VTVTGVAARSVCLDVFRGAAVALMILVNNPGSWQHLYPPLAHAPWHGLTPTDLVFPFFLFAVGNAMACTMPALQRAAAADFWRRWARRVGVVFLIGLLLNASPFVRWDAAGDLGWRSFDNLRFMGVLQRIALAWGGAALIVWAFGRRGACWAGITLLLAYWALCVGLAAGADAYSLEGFFGTGLDRWLLGPNHLYGGEGVPFDPEGLASTLPAVAQVLIGYLAGTAITRAPRRDAALVSRLFVAALVLLVAGYFWQLGMPLNKKLWTSSYVLVSSGMALAAIALLMHHIDLAGAAAKPAAWVAFFDVFGKNALFVFVLSGLLPRLLALLRWNAGDGADGKPVWLTPLGWVYREIFAPIGGLGGDPRLGSLLFALANLAAYWALARWLDRRRIYIKV
jgi:predicted acyltransferase